MLYMHLWLHLHVSHHVAVHRTHRYMFLGEPDTSLINLNDFLEVQLEHPSI